jgi:hypothetical protein
MVEAVVTSSDRRRQRLKPIKFSGEGRASSVRGQGDRGESASYWEDSLPSQ